MSNNKSTRRSEMESSIQQVAERAFFSSQKLIIDEGARVVEERLTKRSRGITADVFQESQCTKNEAQSPNLQEQRQQRSILPQSQVV